MATPPGAFCRGRKRLPPDSRRACCARLKSAPRLSGRGRGEWKYDRIFFPAGRKALAAGGVRRGLLGASDRPHAQGSGRHVALFRRGGGFPQGRAGRGGIGPYRNGGLRHAGDRGHSRRAAGRKILHVYHAAAGHRPVRQGHRHRLSEGDDHHRGLHERPGQKLFHQQKDPLPAADPLSQRFQIPPVPQADR